MCTGFSHDTIRFCEKKGLIEVSRRERRSNSYKDPESVYEKLVLQVALAVDEF